MKLLRALLSLTLLIAGLCSSYAQSKRLIIPDTHSSQYYVERWTTDDGLPANTLIHALKSKKGYIWITSFDGIIKFDGMEFTTLNKANNNLSTNGIGQIEEDSNEKLWISTYGEGIMSYSNGQFKNENDENFKNQSIQTLYIDKKDQVWIGTRGDGLYYHDGTGIKRFKYHPLLENINIGAIAQSPHGAMWFGTEGNGLIRYENDQFQVFTEAHGLPEDKIFKIYFDHNNVMWIGTNMGLARFNGTSFELIDGVNNCIINTLFEDDDNNLWVATACGLFKKTAEDGTWFRLPLDDVIPSDFFTHAFMDDHGSIWLTTYHAGLAHIKKSKLINYTIWDGLATKAISSIAEINTNVFLVGTNNGTINIIDNGKVSKYKFNTPIPNTRIRSLLQDNKGNLWIGTSGGVLIKKKSGEEIWYTSDNGLPDNEVRLFYEDSNKIMWFGTRAGGLVKVIDADKGEFQVLDKNNLLNSNFIMSIQEDKQGNLYIGTNESGLNVLKSDGTIKYITKEDGLGSNLIFNTYTDDENTTWIVTNGGICRLKDNKFFNITASHGLKVDAPFDFIEDKFGDVWLPTSKGVIKTNKQQLNDFADGSIENINFRLYDKQDGLELAECTGAAKSVLASDGNVWIPALNGVFVIRPEKIGFNKTASPVFITQITADNESPFIKNDSIELDADVQRVIIRYEALNFTSPSKVTYKFMLENFDDDWVHAENKREAQYTNLHHGRYTFKVMASNEDGVWNKEPTALTITVAPHFYETPLFLAAVTVTIALLIFGVFRLSIYNIRQRNKLLSILVKEQTSELMEINCTLEEQKEELITQHDLLAHKNLELENVYTQITSTNNQLTRVNSKLEEIVEERTKDLTATLEKLKVTNDELDTFIYRASHDLKGPTASLLGLAMLGKAISDDARYIDFFNRIEETSHNMNSILGKLISMHVILQTTVSYTPINLEAFIIDIKKSLRITNSSCKLINQTDASLLFHSDQTLLKIIFRNLFENALTFSSPNRDLVIILNVRKKKSSVYISLEDNGEGIEEDVKMRIFDLFYRGSQKSKGNGLGLYLVKKAAEKLNGKVEMETEPGEFTRFTVILPSKDIA